MVLVLGDAHADEPGNRDALLAAYDAADAAVALQLGDLLHYDLPTPTYFIAGNNEDQDVIAALRAGRDPPDSVENATLLASDAVDLEGRRVAGLSGNYAPTRFDKARDDLVGDRRRHFTHEDIDEILALDDVDVLLVHEAPHGVITGEDYDVGCTHVDRVLRELEPALCLVGHHHEHQEGRFGGTRVVSLAPAWAGYYSLDLGSLGMAWHPLEEWAGDAG